MLFTKSKLNRIEVLISKSLIDLNISHDEFISISNVLRLWRNETTNFIQIFKSFYKTKVVRTNNGRILILSNCAVCDSKNWKFNKQQEVGGLLEVV